MKTKVTRRDLLNSMVTGAGRNCGSNHIQFIMKQLSDRGGLYCPLTIGRYLAEEDGNWALPYSLLDT